MTLRKFQNANISNAHRTLNSQQISGTPRVRQVQHYLGRTWKGVPKKQRRALTLLSIERKETDFQGHIIDQFASVKARKVHL